MHQYSVKLVLSLETTTKSTKVVEVELTIEPFDKKDLTLVSNALQRGVHEALISAIHNYPHPQ